MNVYIYYVYIYSRHFIISNSLCVSFNRKPMKCFQPFVLKPAQSASYLDICSFQVLFWCVRLSSRIKWQFEKSHLDFFVEIHDMKIA